MLQTILHIANTDDASCNYDSNNDITPSDWVTPDTDCNATIFNFIIDLYGN